MRHFPLSIDGHQVKLERPEEGCNRFAWRFTSFAHVSATGFPLEHWSESGIRTAFRSVGSVCCIDPLCLEELDFLAVRLVVKLEHASDIPNPLIVRDAFGDSSAIVRLSLVGTWQCAEDGMHHACVHYDSSVEPPPAASGGRCCPRMSDIDEESMRGASPPPRCVLPLPPPSSTYGAELWRAASQALSVRQPWTTSTGSRWPLPLPPSPRQRPRPRCSRTRSSLGAWPCSSRRPG
jgi:hypothetical protein